MIRNKNQYTFTEERLTYKSGLRDKWLKKELQEKWESEPGSTFDADDLRLALRTPVHHFGEWFVARYYEQRGYKVLVEKYIYKNHLGKIGIMQDRWPKLLTALRGFRKQYKCQPPDLLVYRDNQYFFVEVKLNTDFLSDEQKQCFERIERRFRHKVLICSLKVEL